MLGDGDAKTHAKIIENDPYSGIVMEKIEWVNHVTKWMGTVLRTLVEKRKAQKLPIGGCGKLMDEHIKNLTSYYGKAIKDSSGCLKGMEKAVRASLFHTLSTDEDPHHPKCPPGTTSWCFFQRALAAQVELPPHNKPLPCGIGEALLPIHQRLGDPQLLKRCL